MGAFLSDRRDLGWGMSWESVGVTLAETPRSGLYGA